MIDGYKKKLAEGGEVYLRIKVRPNSPKSEIKELMDDETIKIAIHAAPVKGNANKELIAFLAREFKVQKDAIKLISGAGEPLKLIKIKI